MHHLYPLAKGDQLCPLGFHPQVRWPTRCKRCFRDYKEHGGKRGDDIASSSPSLSDTPNLKTPGRSWTSTQNLASTDNGEGSGIELRKRPSSWTSTPDLDDSERVDRNSEVSFRIQLPQRRHTITDAKEIPEETFTIKRPPLPHSATNASSSSSSGTQTPQAKPSQSAAPASPTTPTKEVPSDLVILKTDSLAERVRKMNLLKKQNSLERESSRERSVPRKIEKEKSPSVERTPERRRTSAPTQTSQTLAPAPAPAPAPSRSPEPPRKVSVTLPKKTAAAKKQEEAQRKSQDVQFLIAVKNSTPKKQDDASSTTTDTTDATLTGTNEKELQDEIKILKQELDAMKARAERAERDKSDILLRRLASVDTGHNRTAASEALKLQQKVNELKTQLEDLKDDKRVLSIKVKELEQDLNARPAKTVEDDLRRKLQAAEQLCEELMDENEDIKKELKGMESEIDEMHDNFREDQVEEFTSLRKDLEQTTKNCRILSFKLKKSERKIDQLEMEKQALGSQNNSELSSKVKKLEEDLRQANELARRLQAEAEQSKIPGKTKTPTLGVLGKSTSADGKFSRTSLTRGGSQEDPAQLMRDLQDSMEREADLKEQLKFAEEEAETLRKKASRVEDENESLMMQLKKMASKARTPIIKGRRLSPNNRLTPEPPVEHDEGISDEDDPAELRVLLELNEQEASVLRQKVEDLEAENTATKTQIKDLQEKLKASSSKKLPSLLSKTSTQTEKKLKVLEDEMAELRKSIIEKDRSIERLQAEVKSKSGKPLVKSNSLEGNVDLKRQLEVVEQEASVLRTKISTLEQENDKLNIENRKLQVQNLRKNSIPSVDKNGPIVDSAEMIKIKESLTKAEQERDELSTKLKIIIQETNGKLPARTPKRITDLTPKASLKKWVEELEEEIKEMRAVVVNSGGDKLQKLETEKNTIQKELTEAKDKLTAASIELKNLKSTKDTAQQQATKLTDLEIKLKKSQDEGMKLNAKIKDLEEKIKKQDTQIKISEVAKGGLDVQLKKEKEKSAALEKDLEKEKKERSKWETKVADLDNELITLKKNAEKTKSTLEKEVQDLKAKANTNKTETASTKKLQELKKQNEELQANLTKEEQQFAELNRRFEHLSEEHVLNKAKLASERDNLQTEQNTLKQKESELAKINSENKELLKRLDDALKKVKLLEAKSSQSSTVQYEKNLLKASLAEKEQELENLKKENEMNLDLGQQMRRENDELRRKLDDFERVNKTQRTLSEQNNNLESEIRKMKVKLENAELSSKSEVASTRLRYEQQVKNLNAEMSSMQRQCERFKKDRDTFKQLLESAQKKIGELKQNTSGRQSRSSGNSTDEDDKGKIIYLEQQIGCLEDQLSESRLEVSKIKTELVSERSANEIKISEMTSKLNEYEEDRLIASGRTKIPGMKTKLELSWQKEREEQQRLLQETSTLARDLRQTLFEVERERDKERLEGKRKIDQQKRANEEELEEGRKKISELQCDLLELRDAHAKLRTANEKLRRERERFEKEMSRRRLEQDGDRKVGALLQTVDELVKIAPDLRIKTNPTVIQAQPGQTPLKPDVGKSRRSPSPGPNTIQISSVLARLAEASEELRRYQRLCDDDDRTRTRRGGLRRAASTENDNPGLGGSMQRVSSSGKLSRTSPHNGSLYRKSLSLDQSIQQDQSIWRHDDGSMSSMQSIDSELGGMVRDSSMDSRLSGGSTQSDIPRGPRKKKKTLMGKLRSLTKSSKGTESEGSIQGSDSDISMSSDIRSSKKDLKGRISGMFKRSGSTSRSASTEKINDSQQRPVAVTIVGGDESTKLRPVQNSQTTPKPIRPATKPPTPTTPANTRKLAK